MFTVTFPYAKKLIFFLCHLNQFLMVYFQNIHLDKNVMNLVETDFTQLQDFTGMYQQCPPTSPSPTVSKFSGIYSSHYIVLE